MSWLTGWSHRSKFKVTSQAPLTDYQIRLIISKNGFTDINITPDIDLLNICNSDFSDIRFTTSDGITLLNHYVEISAVGYCIVWVKLPEISTTGSYYYLYFGNSSATSISNGDDTFIFFDHFNGSSLDSNKWNIYGGGAAVENSLVKLTGTIQIESKTQFGPNTELVAFIYLYQVGGSDTTEFGCLKDGAYESTKILYRFNRSSYSNTVMCQLNSSVSYLSLTDIRSYFYTLVSIKWNTSKVIFSTNPYGNTYRYYGKITNNIYTDNNCRMFFRCENNRYIYADYVFVRKCEETEPILNGFAAIEKESSTNYWPIGYDNKLILTIPPQDESLVNFPMTVKLSESSGPGNYNASHLFSVVEDNYNTLLITDHLGNNLYTEVCSWDSVNKLAVMNVLVRNLSGIENTNIYIFYNSGAPLNQFIGEVNTYVGKKVWGTYSAVYHLLSTTNVVDSVSGATLSLYGSTSSVEGKLDKSIYFNYSSNSYASLPINPIITDKSSNNHTISGTVGGFTRYSSVGQGKAYFNGSSNYITCTTLQSNYWNLNDKDFTIEAYVESPTTLNTNNYYRSIAAGVESSSNFWSFGFYRDGSGVNKLGLFVVVGGVQTVSASCDYSLPANWITHVAISVSGGSYKVFVDGSLMASGSVSIPSFNNPQLYVGTVNNNWFYGYIDELRISSIGRYNVDYYYPTNMQNDSDQYTMLLLDFDCRIPAMKNSRKCTYECLFKLNSRGPTNQQGPICEHYNSTDNKLALHTTRPSGETQYLETKYRYGSTYFYAVDSYNLNVGEWYYASASLNTDLLYLDVTRNDTYVKSSVSTYSSPTNDTYAVYLARNSTLYADIVLDEIRVSMVSRSIKWRTTTYKSLFDALISYSTELPPPKANKPISIDSVSIRSLEI